MDQVTRDKLLYVKSLKDIKVDVPGFKGELDPHQRVGVAFATIAKQCIIADPCGAGKTVEAIATDLKQRALGEVRRTLVICISDKRWDWCEEYKKFSDLRTYLIEGTREQRWQRWMEANLDTAVTVASYEQVRSDFLVSETDEFKYKTNSPSGLLKHLNYDLIIYDEASVFKSWQTTLADSLRFVVATSRPSCALALTATPLQKTPEDIPSIMDKVVPGLFPSYPDFMDRYLIIKKFEKRSVRGRTQYFTRVTGHQNMDELRWVMAPYFIRRERDELGYKTKALRKVRHVTLHPKQLRAYQDLRASVSDGTERRNLLQVYQQMERIVDTMAYFDPNDHSSAKIDSIMEMLDGELKDEKVLIFSKHHVPLDELRIRLNAANIRYINYTGRETAEEREASRHQFLIDPSIRATLMTTAAEMGKNFHAARVVIFLNHIRNPARIDQIIGRVDRGHEQKSDWICSIHYAAKETFEEDIVPKLDSERATFHKIFGGKDDTIELLSDKQLLELIKNGRMVWE